MILRLALRSLLAHPVRSAVLACGFGLGVAVMGILLGVGQVILEQARSPRLAGGGDVVVSGAHGPVTSAKFVLSAALQAPPLGEQVAVASPSSRATLYLVRNGATRAVRARGGIPSLERAIGDPETSEIASWQDTPADEAWARPDPADVLRAMDRFRPIPDVPARAHSWAEWLYFNGHAGETRFYLAFLVGSEKSPGLRVAGVRLQLERAGRMTSYSDSEPLAEARLLAEAPDITIGRSSVRLEGLRYRIRLDLPETSDPMPRGSPGGPAGRGRRVTGEIFLDAVPGRSLPPITARGAGGWLSGYTVPVMSGALSGTLRVVEPSSGLVGDRADRVPAEPGFSLVDTIPLDGGTGYHDHNWGFWEGVSWQWGQVQHGDVSFVYGRVFPPADAADPGRLPGFLVALGPDGPIGHSTDVMIEETNDPVTGRPRRIVVQGRSREFDLRMELTIEDAEVTLMGDELFGGGMDFLQLRARYVVTGRAGQREFDFTAAGVAETFVPRGREGREDAKDVQ